MCLLTTIMQHPKNVISIVLHNFLWIRYPGLQTTLWDEEDPQTHTIIPGGWREEATLHDPGSSREGNYATSNSKEIMESVQSPDSKTWCKTLVVM